MLIDHNKWSVNEKYVLPEQEFLKNCSLGYIGM